MTVEEAARTPGTNLYRAIAADKRAFEARRAAALEIMEREGCTLEQAFQKLWNVA